MENIQFVITNIRPLGIGNILKCLISALSINDDTVIKCEPDYIYGNYDAILDDKFIFKDNCTKEQEKVYTCRLLIHRNEEEFQEDIPNEEWWLGGLENPKFHHYFSFTKRIDWNYDPNRVHPIVKNRIFSTIDKIIFKDIVLNEVSNISSIFKDNNTLGISVRTWKCKHENDINRAYDFDTYKNKIIEVVNNNSINMIVLSLDNESYYKDYDNLFKELGIEHILLKRSDYINEIQYAIVKVLILGKCNFFIGNRISTFSELVFWFSKMAVKVFTVF